MTMPASSDDGGALPGSSLPLPPTRPAPDAAPRGAITPTSPDAPRDSASAWRPPARPAATWRSLGSGVLWGPRAVAPAVVGRTHAELTDSAVKAIIHHYLDSLAGLPGGGAQLLPSWKATIGGHEYGLDGTYLTVAGVRIPALVLGLIPLPVAGNESKALDKGAWMRAQDYELALPRQAAAADQQEQVKAIRDRTAGERELRQRQKPGVAQ
jgi:hypothetical protein